MTTEADQFRAARELEAQLNERQRRVLDLLVAGKTNGEIGDELGMTLDGAKWNVSEILGKLGLDSREQAAEYWRWRKRTRVPLPNLRGLATMGVVKWAGGVAAVVVVGLVLMGLLSRNDEKPSDKLPPFYLEAQIHMTNRTQPIGTSLAAFPGFELERTSTVKWWQTDTDHIRMEVHSSDPFWDDSRLLLADGRDQWKYEEGAVTYAREPLQPLPAEARLRGPGIGPLLGPAPVSGVSQLLDLAKSLVSPDAEPQRIGTELIAGRQTVVYQFSPATKFFSSGDGGGFEYTVTGEASGKIWLDEERLIVMRYTTTSDRFDVVAEVTRLDYETKLDRSLFVFTPPAGTVESSDADSGSTSVGSRGPRGTAISYTVPAPFIDVPGEKIGFLPYAYQQGNGPDGEPRSFELALASESWPSELLVSEWLAPGGLPDSLRGGDDIVVGGISAKLVQDGDRIRVAFVRDELAITVSGYMVQREDLLTIAESLAAAAGLEVVP